MALFYFQTFHSIIMNISPRLPYDVINFEIDLMKDLGVKIEHGRWPSQFFDFFCLEELRADCKSDLDHVNLVKLTMNSNVYLYLSLSATYSTQIPWKRRPHYWADEKGLWSRYLFSSIYFSWCKKYSPIVRHQEDKAFAIVFFLFVISSDPSTHFISKQLVRLPNNDQKGWSYPDHVDHVKLILLSVAHLILDCCYNDVTTPAAFIFAIWFDYLVNPLMRKQGVFFLYFQNWGCQMVKKIPQTGHYDKMFHILQFSLGLATRSPKQFPYLKVSLRSR